MNTAEFKKRAGAVHNDAYKYSKAEYTGYDQRVIITCLVHGDFVQTTGNHLAGKGCQVCGWEKGTKKRTLTNECFLARSRAIYGDKYDYSLVSYKNSKTRVTIICPKHGNFNQMPQQHLCRGGCPKCGRENAAHKRRLGTKEFIRRSRSVHDDRYDYSKAIYKDSNTKVAIICPDHGVYWQKPSLHMRGSECVKCSYRNRGVRARSSIKEFVNAAQLIHNNEYDYSQVVYKNTSTSVAIICHKHGQFEQSPNTHLSGSGCLECGREKTKASNTKSTDVFINESRAIHGDKYDYSSVEYKGTFEKVVIICPEHGEFDQEPTSHLSDHGCPQCGINAGADARRSNTEEFITKARRIHGDRYHYTKVKYKSNMSHVIITCPKHGDFNQSPSHHLQQQGCPRCKESILEMNVAQSLDLLNIQYQREVSFPGCRNHLPLLFDFAGNINGQIFAIEADGEGHYMPIEHWGGKRAFRDRKKRDKIKDDYCHDHSVPLLRIPYWVDNIDCVITKFFRGLDTGDEV